MTDFIHKLGSIITYNIYNAGEAVQTGTLIAYGKFPEAEYLIAWKAPPPYESWALDPRITIHDISKPISNWKDYTYGWWIGPKQVISCVEPVLPQVNPIVTIASRFDGMMCARCSEPVHMAGPNQADGSFVCRSCCTNPYRNFKKAR